MKRLDMYEHVKIFDMKRTDKNLLDTKVTAELPASYSYTYHPHIFTHIGPITLGTECSDNHLFVTTLANSLDLLVAHSSDDIVIGWHLLGHQVQDRLHRCNAFILEYVPHQDTVCKVT